MPKVPTTKNNKKTSVKESDRYLFFWKPDEKHGWASQWYPSPFTLEVTMPSSANDAKESPSEPQTTEEASFESKECTFPSAEHYMMFRKALLFGDVSIANTILSASRSGTDKRNLAKIKALGREVSNFNDETWVAHRYQIVLDGNLAKFRQNPELKERLFATGTRKLAEASPLDRIWGIGYGATKALQMLDEMGSVETEDSEPEKWGLNLLGKALDETRTTLKAEEPNPS